jgi:predicted NBD/HSP70 family sugar kinase
VEVDKDHSKDYLGNVARGMQPHQVRFSNQRAILSVLSVYPGLSNADIARYTGLAPQTVSSVLDGLEDAGLLRRGPARRGGGRGQPATPLYLNPEGALALGAEIGWTHLEVALTDLVGEVLAHQRVEYAYPDGRSVFGLLADMLGSLTRPLDAVARKKIIGLGLAIPAGLGETSSLLTAPAGQIEAWRSLQAGHEAARVTGYDVQTFNDGNAACFAEYTIMAPPRPGGFVFLLIDTFVAAGIISGDQLWQRMAGATTNLGSMLVSDRAGNRRIIDEIASLSVLDGRLKAGGAALADVMQGEPPAPLQAIVEAWIEDAALALAQAILNTGAVLEIDFAVLESRLPRPMLDRLIEAVGNRIVEIPGLGHVRPSVRAGHIGRSGAAQGAAQLRMVRRYYSRELGHMDDA